MPSTPALQMANAIALVTSQNCWSQCTPTLDHRAFSQLHLFIDDSYLQGETYEGCQENVERTVGLFQTLGFIVPPEKSVLVPYKKNWNAWGFCLNLEDMTVTLSKEKYRKFKQLARVSKERKLAL